MWAQRTGIPEAQFIRWLHIARGKFFDWKKRYGRANEHNAAIPRDHWIEDWERAAIIKYFEEHPLEGYRRLAFMMLDDELVAVSPATVHRVLRAAGLLNRWSPKPNRKGLGFEQPLRAHEHWHIDIAYLNLSGTFYYLCSVLDGFSRAIVHWEIREAMKEADVETILQRARELHPGARPRIISDNGPQFIARDFKEFIRITGMTHVRTSPYYPQSNGKLERYNRTVKSAFRAGAPTSVDEARKVVQQFVQHYNERRLHSAIGFVAPHDMLAGRAPVIWAQRDLRLEAARERRRQNRQIARAAAPEPVIAVA
jgi:putative transposase